VPSDHDLHVRLESALPVVLPAGSRTALFCSGTCFHAHEPLTGLAIVVDGVRHRPAAERMPRRDLAARHGYRSGFWGTVPISMPDRIGDTVALALAVRLGGGREAVVALGDIAVGAVAAAPPSGAAIAVCMATYEPDLQRLGVQVRSLQEQTERDWVCVISDDCSSPEVYAAIERLVADDGRFTCSRSPQRLGFYRNFERALGLAPTGVEAVALCDQDDRWHPEKLQRLRKAIGTAELACSDLRLVDADGGVLRETLWDGRRRDHADLASLLVANSVPGAAMLLRRSLVDLALPFPDLPGVAFHDHWLALAALTAGDIAYVDRPLYDYVRHDAAVLGSASAPGRRRSRWRAAYFYGYLPRVVMAQTLLLRVPSAAPGKRRALQRFVASARSPLQLAGLLARGLASSRVTLGGERAVARGVAWRWLIAAAARIWPRCDSRLPEADGFEQPRLRRWIAGR